MFHRTEWEKTTTAREENKREENKEPVENITRLSSIGSSASKTDHKKSYTSFLFL